MHCKRLVRTAANASMRLLYFSPVHAGSYAQRPHFMVRAWLEWGVESVLWVNPYPCRLPQWQDVRRAARPARPGHAAGSARPRAGRAGAAHRAAAAGPVAESPAAVAEGVADDRAFRRRRAAGRWASAAPAPWRWRRFASCGRPPVFSTRWTIFPSSTAGFPAAPCAATKTPIAAEVDLVMASSTFLADKFARRGLRVEKVLNACETEDDECGMMNENAGTSLAIHHSSFLIPHSSLLPFSATSAAWATGSTGRWWFGLPRRCRRRGSSWSGRAPSRRREVCRRTCGCCPPASSRRPPATWRGSRPA